MLTCSYKLGPGQWVDSIKWYLNSSEIYRIVPSLTLTDRSVSPHHWPGHCLLLTVRVLTFPVGCLTVWLAQSGLLRPGSHQLTVREVRPGCQGLYTCQLTTAAPPFYTAQAGAVMTVFLPPASPPVVSGARASYRLGDSLELTCFSPPSLPPQHQTWTVNGQQVGRRVSLSLSYSAYLSFSSPDYLMDLSK